MLSVRPYAPEDYPLVSAWREKRKVMLVPACFVPPTGFVACQNGAPVAAGFLTKTDSGYASLGGLISDPDSPGEARDQGLWLILQALTDVAYDAGFRIVSAATNLDRLAARYDKLGFTKTDEGLSAFVKVLLGPERPLSGDVPCQPVG